MALPDQYLQEMFRLKEQLDHWRTLAVSWMCVDGVLVAYDPEDPPPWLQAVLNMADDEGNTGLDGPVVVASADRVRPKGHGTRLVEEMNRRALQRAADMADARRSAGL